MKTVFRVLFQGGLAKSFSLILCLVLVSVVIPAPAGAAENNGDYWTTRAPMPTSYEPGGPDRACAGAVVNGKIYAIGGYGTYGGHTGANQEYDPATDTWTKKTSMPTPRSGTAIGVVNGKIYVFGGNTGLGPTNTVEQYDPATDTWVTKAPMPTARFGHEVGVVDNMIYVIGGFLDYTTFTPTAIVEMYDPATDTWTTKASMLAPRGYFGTGVINNKIYAIGGFTSWPPAVSPNEMYDPATNSWTTKAPMLAPRSLPEIGVINNRLYVIGGALADGSIATTNEEYNPATDQWTTRAPMFTARYEFALGVVDDKIYAIGGWQDGYGVPENEEYTPPVLEDPETITQALITTIDTWNLSDGIATSVVSKLVNSLESLENGYPEISISQLHALIHEAQAQRNKKLTGEQADIIIEEALKIIAAIQG